MPEACLKDMFFAGVREVYFQIRFPRGRLNFGGDANLLQPSLRD
jgi:hypothetical protein